jgi:predicted component of type VI protein secretion system
MNQLTLEWVDEGQVKTQTITDQYPGKHPGTFRIGRDPLRCDLVLQHPTVSGLHVEIFFDPRQNSFLIRNLRDTNPPLVDRQKLAQGEALLRQGTMLRLGQVEMRVTAIAPGGLPPTIVTPTQPATTVPVQPTAHPVEIPPTPAYGLKCPKCQQVSPYERLGSGCPWCGTSLAAAVSVLIIPGERA